MSLVSTKLPKRKERDSQPEVAIDSPRFPYGLEITLEDEILKRLGISKLPRVGVELKIRAVGSVTSVSENKNARREDRRVQIQIEKIEVTPPKGSAEDAVSDAIDGLN